MTEPDVKPGDACAMIARCHRHQYPHDYGLPAVKDLDLNAPEQRELVTMIVERTEWAEGFNTTYEHGRAE